MSSLLHVPSYVVVLGLLSLCPVSCVSSVPSSAKITCRDESGRAVDWFSALKHNNGYEYSYIDAETDSSFRQSKYSLDENEGGAIVNTLFQVYYETNNANVYYNHTDGSIFYSNLTYPLYQSTRGGWDNITWFNSSLSSSSFAYVMYNDQHPDGKKTSTYAHSKGVIAFDEHSGFWLTHSVPKWPPTLKKGYAGLPDDKFGQSFICVTFKTKDFDLIGYQQNINRPWVYDSDISDSLAKKLPRFDDWLNDQDPKKSQNIVNLKSAGGVSFVHFAKSKDAEVNLYEDLVAPKIKDDLMVETWKNGGHNLGPFCKGKKKKYDWDVVDVKEVKVNSASWDMNQDHSKWAVSSTHSGGWVCIGDINRQSSQEHRGGGTLCQRNTNLHQTFSKIITDYDKCKE